MSDVSKDMVTPSYSIVKMFGVQFLKDGEQKIDRYYYEDGKLIRWIDDKNRCHDNETDSEEYVTRGEKYWDYADEYKTQLNLSDDSTSAS